MKLSASLILVLLAVALAPISGRGDTMEVTIDILEPTQQTLDALMKLDLSAGVDVEIRS